MRRVTHVLARPWAAYLVVGIGVVGLYFLLPWDTSGQRAVYDATGVYSAIGITAGALLHRPASRLPWFLFAAGQLSFAVGDIIFNFYDASSPSVADVFYLAGYPLIAAGLALLILALRGERLRAGVLEAAIFTVGFALVQWVFVMEKLVHGPSSALSKGVALSYPAADIVLLSALAVFFLTPAWRATAYRYLAASLVLLLVADEVYGASPNAYENTTWLDSGWLLSYVLWGSAALHPTMTALSERSTGAVARLRGPRIGLLAAGLLTAPAVLLIERATRDRIGALPIVIAATLLSLCVLGRFAGMVRSLEELRREERAAHDEVDAARRLLEEQNERLREADEMKDEFVALISHDLRTPLTSIMGYVELVMSDAELTEDMRGYLQIVERNSERLLALVNDLLFVARLEAGELSLHRDELDLAAIARQAAEEAEPRATAKQIELQCSTEEVPSISADRGRMFQLLDNLVSNAIKFTSEGGRVDVRVARRSDGVRMEVSDTGIGIAEGDQGRLFHRFFRAATARDRQIPGTGLGLYISRAIVEAHGGQIQVDSEAGVGTTFCIDLPFVRESERAEPELVS